MSEPDVFVVSGPSGAGKTTLVRRLLAATPDLDFSVSYTTRTPRIGEREGHDYHFVSDQEFDRMEREGEFLESARVHGRRYGTSARLIQKSLDAGRDVLLDVDTQGARSVRLARPRAVLIFILPPGMETLKTRLISRGQESAAEVERRLQAALAEIEQAGDYDHLVVNEDLERAFAQLQSIVAAHRSRAPRQQDNWRRIVESFHPAGVKSQQEKR